MLVNKQILVSFSHILCLFLNDSTCCDAATCKLKSGAICDKEPCCQYCQIARNGVLCRESSDECDLVELCQGIGIEVSSA